MRKWQVGFALAIVLAFVHAYAANVRQRIESENAAAVRCAPTCACGCNDGGPCTCGQD
jgi:hypothetical protein